MVSKIYIKILFSKLYIYVSKKVEDKPPYSAIIHP